MIDERWPEVWHRGPPPWQGGKRPGTLETGLRWCLQYDVPWGWGMFHRPQRINRPPLIWDIRYGKPPLKLQSNGTKITYPVTRLHTSATVQPSLHGLVSDNVYVDEERGQNKENTSLLQRLVLISLYNITSHYCTENRIYRGISNFALNNSIPVILTLAEKGCTNQAYFFYICSHLQPKAAPMWSFERKSWGFAQLLNDQIMVVLSWCKVSNAFLIRHRVRELCILLRSGNMNKSFASENDKTIKSIAYTFVCVCIHTIWRSCSSTCFTTSTLM